MTMDNAAHAAEELQRRIAKQTKTLERIILLAQALKREPVQSQSVNRRYATLIEAAAQEGLL